jgi:hypothetical protein
MEFITVAVNVYLLEITNSRPLNMLKEHAENDSHCNYLLLYY